MLNRTFCRENYISFHFSSTNSLAVRRRLGERTLHSCRNSAKDLLFTLTCPSYKGCRGRVLGGRRSHSRTRRFRYWKRECTGKTSYSRNGGAFTSLPSLFFSGGFVPSTTLLSLTFCFFYGQGLLIVRPSLSRSGTMRESSTSAFSTKSYFSGEGNWDFTTPFRICSSTSTVFFRTGTSSIRYFTLNGHGTVWHRRRN